jgi:acyl-CoA synthetase (AMP-forming)/AMP-acid ligase II
MAYNVAHFLAQQAVAQPTAAAVRAPLSHDSDGSIRYVERSFAELDAESSAAAHYFSMHGIRRGSRVLLMVRPGSGLDPSGLCAF